MWCGVTFAAHHLQENHLVAGRPVGPGNTPRNQTDFSWFKKGFNKQFRKILKNCKKLRNCSFCAKMQKTTVDDPPGDRIDRLREASYQVHFNSSHSYSTSMDLGESGWTKPKETWAAMGPMGFVGASHLSLEQICPLLRAPPRKMAVVFNLPSSRTRPLKFEKEEFMINDNYKLINTIERKIKPNGIFRIVIIPLCFRAAVSSPDVASDWMTWQMALCFFCLASRWLTSTSHVACCFLFKCVQMFLVADRIELK